MNTINPAIQKETKMICKGEERTPQLLVFYWVIFKKTAILII